MPNPAWKGIGILAKGWRTGTILSIKSGLPFTVVLSGQRSRSGNAAGGNSDRPNLVPGWSVIQGGVDHYFNPACFSIQDAGFLGNLGRATFMGPLHATWDFSLSKDTPIPGLGEGRYLEFRAELFNILNHPDLNIPTTGRTVYTANETTAVTTPLDAAGKITSTVGTARQIQFALRFVF